MVSSKVPFYLKGTWTVEGQEDGEFTIRIIGLQEVSLNIKGKGKKFSQIFKVKSTVPVAAAIESAKEKIDKIDGIKPDPNDFKLLADQYKNDASLRFDYESNKPDNIELIASNKYIGLKYNDGKYAVPLSRRYTYLRSFLLEGQDYLIFTKDGKKGVTFLDEPECVPNIYDEINVDNDNPSIIWGTTQRGIEMIKISEDKDQRATSLKFFKCSQSEYIRGNYYFTVKLDGRWGVVDENLNLIVDAEYDLPLRIIDDVYYDDGFIAVKDGKYGAIGLDSSILIPFEYDYIKYCGIGEFEGFNILFKGTYDSIDEYGSLVNAKGRWGIMLKGRAGACPFNTEEEAETAGYNRDDGEYESVLEEEAIMFNDATQKPSFMGGDQNEFAKWVDKNLVYPAIAADITGKVTVQFTVEKDGSITNVIILRSLDPALDAEAVRVIESSPKWTPGYNNGHPVRVTYTFPVIFRLK